MKFISSSNELLRSLKDILYVINITNKLPILENFLFKIKEKNVLTITVSDLEITMTISLNINSINFGSAVIPHKILLEILKKIPEQPLTFWKEKENKLKILSQNGEYDLSIFSSEEYPKYSLLRNKNHFLPTFLDLRTYRYRGHSMSDSESYRSKKEINEFKSRDPILLIKKYILDKKLVSEKILNSFKDEMNKKIEECVNFAEMSNSPNEEKLYSVVYYKKNSTFLEKKNI